MSTNHSEVVPTLTMHGHFGQTKDLAGAYRGHSPERQSADPVSRDRMHFVGPLG